MICNEKSNTKSLEGTLNQTWASEVKKKKITYGTLSVAYIYYLVTKDYIYSS